MAAAGCVNPMEAAQSCTTPPARPSPRGPVLTQGYAPLHREASRSAARTRELTLAHLRTLKLDGEDLLHEALLDRGHPVVREGGALWMPRGPHARDLADLGHHLGVAPVIGHARYQARLELGTRDAWSTAERIMWIPSFRPPAWYEPRWLPWAWSDAAWSRFCRTAYGHSSVVGWDGHRGGLDPGIALLAKVLPLVRVSTSQSCDGHGEGPALLRFTSPFDATWCFAVVERLAFEFTATEVTWDPAEVTFHPTGGFTDEGLLAMLNDLQALGRRLLDVDLSQRAGRARTSAVTSFEDVPDLDQFLWRSLGRLAAAGFGPR